MIILRVNLLFFTKAKKLLRNPKFTIYKTTMLFAVWNLLIHHICNLFFYFSAVPFAAMFKLLNWWPTVFALSVSLLIHCGSASFVVMWVVVDTLKAMPISKYPVKTIALQRDKSWNKSYFCRNLMINQNIEELVRWNGKITLMFLLCFGRFLESNILGCFTSSSSS